MEKIGARLRRDRIYFNRTEYGNRQTVRLKLLKFKMAAYKNAIILCTTIPYYVNT